MHVKYLKRQWCALLLLLGVVLPAQPAELSTLEALVSADCAAATVSYPLCRQGTGTSVETYCATGGSYAKCGTPRLLSAVVASADSLSAATISTTETIFATLYNIPAGYLTANRLLEVTWAGEYTASASPPTAIFRVRYGGIAGTILYTSNTLALPASRTTEGWVLPVLIANIGASSASASVYTQHLAAAPSGAGASPPTNQRTNQPVTVDTTAALDLVLTLQFSANTAGNSVDVQLLKVVGW